MPSLMSGTAVSILGTRRRRSMSEGVYRVRCAMVEMVLRYWVTLKHLKNNKDEDRYAEPFGLSSSSRVDRARREDWVPSSAIRVL